jgi:predicted unusual protein kinase regulating ubiquinone biosynthesis (AarF/ABC1/UbiB family)
MDIKDKARKYLMTFLLKILKDDYSQNELENLFILKYQDADLEDIRQEIMKIINPTGKSSIEDIQTIRSDQKSRIKEILVDLESISVSKL